MFVETQELTFLDRNPSTGELDLVQHRSLHDGGAPFQRQEATLSQREGGHIVIIGAGVSGLTAAYDLLKQNEDRTPETQFRVTVLEAAGRVGGRSITLRPGNPARPTPEDSFTEDFVDGSGVHRVITQTCTFERTEGEPYAPYLNAGPGRIPSGHLQVLNLCQELGVELEVYVMETRSNLVLTRNEAGDGSVFKTWTNRQVVNDIRGHIAKELHDLLQKEGGEADGRALDPATRKNLLALLRSFGALTLKGNEVSYSGSQRAGFETLPGLQAGKLLQPLPMNDLANANFPARALYQAEDFLWQQTSFQPVGGMDMIEKRLEQRIREMARRSQPHKEPILLDCPVAAIRKFSDQWVVTYRRGGGLEYAVADFCLVNMPIPLLRDKVRKDDFTSEYWECLNKVMRSDTFLRPTCKVGWQAERKLWQRPATKDHVPIYGGISRIDHPMTQMWYPSDQWHAPLGVLTGAYNYEAEAARWGKMLPSERIQEARRGAAALHGESFANQLRHGISIAWQNMPYLRGGWASWDRVSNDVNEQAHIMNTIRRGEGHFYVLGDQVSFLPGWKEGAVMAALEVFARVTDVAGYHLPELARVPNTQELVEGYMY